MLRPITLVALSMSLLLPPYSFAQEAHAKERLFAWKLGVKLAKVAWAYHKGVPAEGYQEELDICKQLATKGLSTSVPAFGPIPADSTKAEVAALNYIADAGAKPIARDLQAKYGESMAALFELAMKADLAQRLYVPGKKNDSLNVSIQKGLANAGERSGLPAKLWQPLVDTIANDGTHAAVERAVKLLDERVTEHLKTQVGIK